MGGYYNSHAWDSNPEYNEELWNYDGCDESVLENNNCYSYAIDDPFNEIEGKPQPGDYSDCSFNCLTIEDITAAALADGFLKKPNLLNKMGFGKRGYYEVYLAVDNVDCVQDYHWYRRDKGGRWSHKRGITRVSQVDASKNLIFNPARANRNYGVMYNPYCGYGNYNLNNGGIVLWRRR